MRLSPAIRIAFSCLIVFTLLCISAATSRVWYDDTGHWRVTKTLLETGEIAYPLETAQKTIQADPHSQFITCGPLFHYAGMLWMQAFGTGFYTARILMLLYGALFLFLFSGISARLIAARKVHWVILLLGLSIQFLTYGANYLGELPMLCLLLPGLYSLSVADAANRPFVSALLSGCFLGLSALVKEYVLLPLALFFLFSLVHTVFIAKNKRLAFSIVLSGLVCILIFFAGMQLRFGNSGALLAFISERRKYGSEFLAFHFSESVPFLLTKPLVILGTAALALRVWVKRRYTDRLFLFFQIALLLFFLAGAGLDRMGLLLMPVPAIYLAEFCQTAWEKWGQGGRRFIRIPAFLLLFLLFFSQTTFLRLTQRLRHPEKTNEGEKWTAAKISELGLTNVFTFDETLAPFLPDTIRFRVYPLPPWFLKGNKISDMPPIHLKKNECFLLGPYGMTEYASLFDLSTMRNISSGPGYSIWLTPE